MPDLKPPSALMQGLITGALMLNFTFMLLAPSIFPGYRPPSEALMQTLVNLVLLAVGYYLGSSQGSARKDELNAAQQNKALTLATTVPAAPVKIDDTTPVKVQESPSP